MSPERLENGVAVLFINKAKEVFEPSINERISLHVEEEITFRGSRERTQAAADLPGIEQLVPPERVVVGESGITSPADLARLARAGISTFLVGESLMRQPDIATATSALLTPAQTRARDKPERQR